jgi:hypothetical protein
MSEKLKFVTKKGECFELELKSSAPALGTDRRAHVFEITDLVNKRGTCRVALSLSCEDQVDLETSQRVPDAVLINFIRRAFDNGDLSFDTTAAPPAFKEMIVRATDLDKQAPCADPEIRDFICHKAYWLAYRYNQGEGWPVQFDEEIDLDYLAVDQAAVRRNIRMLDEKGLIVKSAIPGEGRPTATLVGKYLYPNQDEHRSSPVIQNTFNLQGPHSRVNLNSTDNSTNISNTMRAEIFSHVRDEVSSNLPANDLLRTDVLTRLEQLERAVGTPNGLGTYAQFAGFVADHLTILNFLLLYLPILAQLASAPFTSSAGSP